MTDWGLKISLPGYDVKNATPEQCALHSSYDTLKIKSDLQYPQEGNILITFTKNQTIATTIPLYTIIHNYNYPPAYYFFHDVEGSYKALSQETGNLFSWDSQDSLYFQAVPESNEIVFQLVVTQTYVNNISFGNNVANQYYAFRYYIFANDGI